MFSVFGDHSDSGEDGGKEAELDVPEPDRDLASLEDFLQVNAGEAREKAGNENCGESNSGISI